MGCNRNTEKCYFDPWEKVHMPQCCQKHLKETIYYLAELFEEKKIKYWIHFGTLLGAVRDKQIIPWDSDADFGVLQEDKPKIEALIPKMQADGYGFFWLGKDLWQISYSPINWIYCDLWFFTKTPAYNHKVGAWTKLAPILYDPLETVPIKSNEPIMTCSVDWAQENHTLDFPHWFIEKRKLYDLNGKKLFGPRCGKMFCELLYGPGWRYPIGKDYSNMCGNFYSLSTWLRTARELERKRTYSL